MFSEQSAVIQSTILKRVGQLLLQATLGLGPKTSDMEIEIGSVQSDTPPSPNGLLQAKVDDHFWDHAPAVALSKQSATSRARA